MSYQRGTTHYNLPQTIGTDKRDWSDTNQAFSDVDAALYAASENASGAASAVTALDTRLTTQEGKMSAAEGDIAALQASDTTQDTTLLQHGQKISNIEESLTTEAITPTNVLSGIDVKAVRSGNVVMFTLFFNGITTSEDNALAFNLPVTFRKIANSNNIAARVDSIGSAGADFLIVDGDGAVRIRYANTHTTWCTGTLVCD